MSRLALRLLPGVVGLGVIFLLGRLPGREPGELLEFFDGAGRMPTRIDRGYHRMDDSTQLMSEVGLSVATTKGLAGREAAQRAAAEKSADRDLAKYSDAISDGLKDYTRVSRSIDADSDKSFHTDGTRKDAVDNTGVRQHDVLMKAVGITGKSASSDTAFGVPSEYDDGVPTGNHAASEHSTLPSASHMFHLRDGLHVGGEHGGGGGRPSFVDQANAFIANPKQEIRALEEKQARIDVAAAAAAADSGAGSHDKFRITSRSLKLHSASKQGALKPSSSESSSSSSSLGEASSMVRGGAASREVAVPLPVAAATAAPAEVKGLPMADSEEALQVVKQADGSLMVVDAPTVAKAVAVPVTADRDAGQAMNKVSGKAGEEGRRERRERREERRRRNKAREVRRLSMAFEAKSREEKEERERGKERMDDAVMQDREELEIRKLRKQVRHMKEREEIRRLKESVSKLKEKLSPPQRARAGGRSKDGDASGRKGGRGGQSLDQEVEEGWESEAADEEEEGKKEARGNGGGGGDAAKVPERKVKVCDGIGCNEVVMPDAKKPAEHPNALSKAKTRSEIRDALEGNDVVGDYLMPWEGAWKPEVHLNGKGEIRADHDDPNGVLAPHEKFQNALYAPTSDKPGGEDHAREGADERRGITNRVGKHLFQDNIVKAEVGFNAGLGRHTRAQQQADWERNWEGVRRMNGKGEKIRIG